jgi:hypothetical protein
MDIPKKGVTMEDVNMARALRKTRSGTEEEEETGLFIFLYFHVYQTVILGTPLIP